MRSVLDDIEHEIRSIHAGVSRLDEKLYYLGQRIAALKETRSPERHRARVTSRRVSRSATIGPREIEVYRSAADHGVANLDMTINGTGSALVNVDGKMFTLPPTLALLLRILAEDSGPVDDVDPLVAWKNVDDVAARLRGKTGGAERPGSRHGLNQNIHRLRKRLRRAKVSPFFVQRGSGDRIRFARRRSPTTRET